MSILRRSHPSAGRCYCSTKLTRSVEAPSVKLSIVDCAACASAGAAKATKAWPAKGGAHISATATLPKGANAARRCSS
eukprot:scaffold631_cov378-Prasinococcus_capsulatus_cf.AAC.11